MTELPGDKPLEIPFGDLRRHVAVTAPLVREAINRVLTRGQFILGAELDAFEAEFAKWLKVPHAIGVASGTDALTLALRACGIRPGDEVIVPANTCVPTAAAVVSASAHPVLADVNAGTLTLDPEEIGRRVTPRTRGLIAVHLYGHPCDMGRIMEVADRHHLLVIEDCAQAHGATYAGRACGTFGVAAAFSFYPTKNLGAFGDAGAVVTADPGVASKVRQLRNYGKNDRGESMLEGTNSRLDEIQAAILCAKLPMLDEWNEARRRIAERYHTGLAATDFELPFEAPESKSCWHLYAIRCAKRTHVIEALRKMGIGTAVHYPMPLHFQEAYKSLAVAGGFPVAEQACTRVLSLPLYPDLQVEEVARVIQACILSSKA